MRPIACARERGGAAGLAWPLTLGFSGDSPGFAGVTSLAWRLIPGFPGGSPGIPSAWQRFLHEIGPQRAKNLATPANPALASLAWRLILGFPRVTGLAWPLILGFPGGSPGMPSEWQRFLHKIGPQRAKNLATPGR